MTSNRRPSVQPLDLHQFNTRHSVMGLSHGCRVLSDSEIEVYMVCEKGASDQQKLKSSVYIEGVWGQNPQENFVDTLFTLA